MNATFGTGNVKGERVTILGREFAHIGNTFYTICDACSGTGYRPGYGYSDGSRCWPCGYLGIMKRFAITGTLDEATKVVAKRVKAAAARVAKNMKNAKVAADAHRAWMDANPLFTTITNAVLADEYAFSPLLRELALKLNSGNPLTPAQLDLMETMYTRESERKSSQAAANADKTWIGTVGEKVTVTGTVTYTKAFDGDYGVSTLVRIATAEGNYVSWYAKGVSELEKDATVTIAGKVKTHRDSPEYGKETKLFYVKLV